ncbi:hypothetical protein BT96DRAFT_975525 [Gymnopus androsaceus JB14]|uniref:Uncharacterized protein n=1 Tax=Gymnopus androsaceus JB14 TaxID=1447944 RepID=A0A6A4HR00_9AGAR|nr:hypothetical protein BT96DRAFT_975525 [Gymnopus androsaceus JB14]
MATIAKIVFPPPPPTINTLTYSQRTQLMRSTKKLGRVLGITPQLIDIYPSVSSSSSHTEDSWLNSDAKPLLRLAMSSPSFDNVVGSSDAESSPSSLSFSDDETDSNAEDMRYTIRPNLSEPTRDSFLSVPAFHIPSSNSLRLAKMDRIRKKLGDDVPIHLVFPNEDEMDSASADSCSTSPDPSVTIHWRPLPPIPNDDACSPLTSVITLPSSHPHPRTRLSNARDSILVQTSRQNHKIKRKPVPKFDSLEELALQSLSIEVERRKAKERLSLILELPHEHDDENDLLTSESNDSTMEERKTATRIF